MNQGQELALKQLRDIECVAEDGELEILGVTESKNNYVCVTITLSCKDIPRAPEGLPLQQRERFNLWISPDFPFKKPDVYVEHDRFAGFPHVQWKCYLCLYQTSSEWDPNDGMFGFIERLRIWLEHGAINQLDPIGAPLHPPVTYVDEKQSARIIIPSKNTPPVLDSGWLGFASLSPISETCLEITNWIEDIDGNDGVIAAAILLPGKMPFEFPTNVSILFNELFRNGVSKERLLAVMQLSVLKSPADSPLYVILGTAMRGVSGSSNLLQHLTAWYIHPTMVTALRLSIEKYSDHEKLQEIGKKAEDIFFEWANTAKVEWCRVLENRQEIITRRDEQSLIRWFKDKTVSLWGCGALGSHVAELLVRAGVKKLILRDNGRVTPGIIVRQLYEKSDIGKTKVSALKDKLAKINPEVSIDVYDSDILNSVLASEDWPENADIVIDTTASKTISAKLEMVRYSSRIKPVPIISMMIGHKAERGLVVMARSENLGGTFDVLRKAKLAVCNNPTFSSFADEFWPVVRRTEIFQPEPGCSDITFVGSAVDVTSLVGMLLNFAANDLASSSASCAFSHFVTQPHLAFDCEKEIFTNFSWNKDFEIIDSIMNFRIRISPEALEKIHIIAKQNVRTRGASVETGGVLFGERDDVLKIIWVTEVIGPPPDSVADNKKFICGVSGVGDFNSYRKKQSRGAVKFIGMWHTHPFISPCPSDVDLSGMLSILSEKESASSKVLLMIVGGNPVSAPSIGGYVFEVNHLRENPFIRIDPQSFLLLKIKKNNAKNVGLCLSGGGSRAIAFHLGCLRALHNRGILERIDVVSAVSGGAVIAAMYAYSDDRFEEFDRRVVKLLKKGLQGAIAWRAFLSLRTFSILATFIFSVIPAFVICVLRKGLSLIAKAVKIPKDVINLIERIPPPFCRWANRTSAFEDVLRKQIFGNKKIFSNRRNSINVVINACELRTGSAFRFGSKESGCWRFGKLKNNDVDVAHAVAASAAYPALLPAIDRKYRFVDKNEKVSRERVFLTDGGVYDNLGITCLEPGRSSEYSSNVFAPEYIICCAAGQGLFEKDSYPYWWVPRMVRSFLTVHRKLHDCSYSRLHKYLAYGEIKGFVLSFLGQQDNKLPVIPPDLVKRKEVYDYPTDFASMSEKDINLLSKRGEQLTEMLLSYYCPEL